MYSLLWTVLFTFLTISLQSQLHNLVINTASLLKVRKCNSKTDTGRIPNRTILQNTDVTFALSVTFRTWRLRRSELWLCRSVVWGRANWRHLPGCSRGGTCMEWESSSRHFSLSFGGLFTHKNSKHTRRGPFFKVFFCYWGIFEEGTDENIWNKEEKGDERHGANCMRF